MSWPGTSAEAATETMLTMSTLIVVGKVPIFYELSIEELSTHLKEMYILSSSHTSTLNLTLVASHHIFIPTQKPVVPITFLIDPVRI